MAVSGLSCEYSMETARHEKKCTDGFDGLRFASSPPYLLSDHTTARLAIQRDEY